MTEELVRIPERSTFPEVCAYMSKVGEGWW